MAISLTNIVFLFSSVFSYSLKDSYSGSTFFDGWDFFTSSDPTHGYVNYVDQSTAQSNGYINASNNDPVYIGCDNTNTASGSGRDSIRITSKNSYSSGLFILDLEHMPFGCGTWPAFWMFGPDWPNNGEIDIIEGVNTQSTNQMTLHTANNCNEAGQEQNFTGKYSYGSNGQPAENCYVDASGQYNNQGCGIVSSDSTSYGEGLNNANGGVIATEIDRSSGIRIWWFQRNNIPSDITNQNPNPDSWGIPVAAWPFGSWCPASNFNNLNIVFDLTFCGDWAGSVWSNGCSASTGDGSCNNYVQYNPSAFKNAYWLVNYVDVYQ